MGWVKTEKWPEPFIGVLLNCPDEKHRYKLGWHNGIDFCDENDIRVKPSEWHKLPNPPIRDNKLVCKKSA